MEFVKILSMLSIVSLLAADGSNAGNPMKLVPNFECKGSDNTNGVIVNGICYTIYADKLSQLEATNACMKTNGTLAQYTSADVSSELIRYSRSVLGDREHVWTGLKFSDNCELDGTEEDISTILLGEWVDKQKSCDQTIKKYCAAISLVNDALYINEDCQEAHPYICKSIISNDENTVKGINQRYDEEKKDAKPSKSVDNINKMLGGIKGEEKRPEVEAVLGDVLLTFDDMDVSKRRRKRSINQYVDNLHPLGQICYKIDRTPQDGRTFTDVEVAMIKNNMEAIMGQCCVTFIPYNASVCSHYIRIFNGNGCYSYLGKKVSGTDAYGVTFQDMSLYSKQPYTCFLPEIIQHELFHAIGFYHELNRPDRSLVLDVAMENVNAGAERNFEILDYGRVSAVGTFDILSTLGYTYDEFVNDDALFTNVPKNVYKLSDAQYYGFSTMSTGDINKCNTLYQRFCEKRGVIPTLKPGWGNWGTWASCSAQCGQGTRQRRRECNLENGCTAIPGSPVDSKTCRTEPCPSDQSLKYRHLGLMMMSNFPNEEWVLQSSETANMANQTQACAQIAREQGYTEFGLLEGKCYLPYHPLLGHLNVPTPDGIGSSTFRMYSALDTYTLRTDKQATELMTALWGPWGDWSQCSKMCGGGLQTRLRYCLYPDGEQESAAPCQGANNETLICNLHNCEYDCGSGRCGYGTCDNNSTCVCLPGYTGSYCDSHIDVCDCCSKADRYDQCGPDLVKYCCDVKAACVPMPNSYQPVCLCPENFVEKRNGDTHQCIARCVAYGCPENADCVPETGICRCKTGYKISALPNCEDLDECDTGNHSCSPDAYCENKQGEYECLCKPGFFGDGFTCTEVTCHNDRISPAVDVLLSSALHVGPIDSRYGGPGVTMVDFTDPNAHLILSGTNIINHPASAPSGFTVAIWAKFDSIPMGTDAPIVLFSSGSGAVIDPIEDFEGVIMYADARTQLRIIWSVSSGIWKSVVTAPIDTDGMWHHYSAVWHPNGQAALYIDGMLKGAQNGYLRYATPVNFNTTFFGRTHHHSTTNFRGSMATFQIYNKVLTSAEVLVTVVCKINIECVSDLCDNDATCSNNVCTCNEGFTGNGLKYRCYRNRILNDAIPVPDRWYPKGSLDDQQQGSYHFTSDEETPQLSAGPYEDETARAYGTGATSTKSDVENSCLGDPDLEGKGCAIAMDLFVDSSRTLQSYMAPQYILSSGGHPGSTEAGFTVYMIGNKAHIIVQTLNKRYEQIISFPMNEWTHLAIVYSAGSGEKPASMGVYINGELNGYPTSTDESKPDFGSVLTLGKPNNCDAFRGNFAISNVAVYENTLSTDEVNAIANSKVVG